MSIQNKINIIKREKQRDYRGWFLKIKDGLEKDLSENPGEIYITSAISGESKGGHYHLKTNEWFTIIKGKCIMKLYDIDDNDYFEMILEEDTPKTIFIPKRIAHSFENNSNDSFLLIAYTDRLYEPSDTLKYDFSKK